MRPKTSPTRAGTSIGTFRKEFAKSLLRSTWQLTAADGVQATGAERNANIAIARRLWEFLPVVSDLPSPFLFHFDFIAPRRSDRDEPSVRRRSLRDR